MVIACGLELFAAVHAVARHCLPSGSGSARSSSDSCPGRFAARLPRLQSPSCRIRSRMRARQSSLAADPRDSLGSRGSVYRCMLTALIGQFVSALVVRPIGALCICGEDVLDLAIEGAGEALGLVG